MEGPQRKICVRFHVAWKIPQGYTNLWCGPDTNDHFSFPLFLPLPLPLPCPLLQTSQQNSKQYHSFKTSKSPVATYNCPIKTVMVYLHLQLPPKKGYRLFLSTATKLDSYNLKNLNFMSKQEKILLLVQQISISPLPYHTHYPASLFSYS